MDLGSSIVCRMCGTDRRSGHQARVGLRGRQDLLIVEQILMLTGLEDRLDFDVAATRISRLDAADCLLIGSERRVVPASISMPPDAR